jgi:hypothetical protein
MIDLNADTVMIVAYKAYEVSHCIKSEFKEDFKHFNYIKRLFRRYQKDSVLKERLILNHLVIIYNTFDSTEATRLLFYYAKEQNYPLLKTFLLYLSRMPEHIEGIRGRTLYSYDIPIDPIAVRFLKALR